ncbi:serine hydrolase [Verrucomicrobia bacterium]|jgi:CubicO group peptidase (beta-lactamase class C family)|nr:serine hydrolase [Verrucomicrobiota bacterium]
MAAKAKPMANRGTKFIYNNLIYGTSDQAACLQAGMSWQNLLENEAIRKLGLESTAYSINKAKNPIGYTLSKGIISPVFNQPLAEIIEPSAGLIITMNDLLNWGQSCIDSNRDDLVKKPSVNQELWKEHIEIAPGLKYGIGFQLRNFNGCSLVEHYGGLPGFSSYMALMPEIKIGLFLVANFFPTSILSQSAGWIFETLLNKSFCEPAASSVDPDYAQKSQGEYIANYGIWKNEKAIISKSDKSLFLALPNQEKQEIQFQKCDDWNPLEFDTNTTVRIEGTNSGKASCISLRQG